MMFARLAVPSDEQDVVDLAKMQVAETLPHLGFEHGVAEETFRRGVRTADPTFFVVEEDRVVIGFLMAFMNSYAFASGLFTSQEVIYVRPDRRGTRAAVHLVKIFNEWSDRLNAKEIFTGIANGHQPERTAAFFEHFGFQRVGLYLRRIRSGAHG